MPGTSILRSDYFFLFFFARHCPLFPCLALFFSGLVSIDLRTFYLFFGYFSIFFYGISFELGPFFMGYVSSLLTTKGS